MDHHEQPPRREPHERWLDEEDDLPQPPPMRRGGLNERRSETVRRSTQVMTFLLLGVLVLMVLAYTYLKDEPRPWEDDLKRSSMTEESQDLSAPSRMKYMLMAGSKIRLIEYPNTPPWEWDTPSLAQALDDNGMVLDNLRDLLEEKTEEWSPRNLLWMVEDFGADSAWHAVMKLKQAESAYLSRSGREEAAFLAAMDLARLGHLLEQLDAWPSFMDRSLDLHQASAQSLAMLLRRTQLDAQTLRRLQEEVYRPWAPSATALREAMSGFYGFERKLLVGPEDGEPPLPEGYIPVRTDWLLFKPNATLHLFADSFRELKSESSATVMARQNQIGFRMRQRAKGGMLIPDGNATGEEYFATRIQPYFALPDRHGLARAQHASIMTLFAVRRFLLVEARVPKDAGELTAAYLPEDVVDPFTGARLRINLASGLIYSVGTDMRDDGGRVSPLPLDDPTEPTLEIGVSVAKPASS
ncbi:hypothetical protein DES53_101231 [Roseimicrobium gellanilyticum]|uniref:Uncharacterized protein n=2 Tax=Roseimicrobium gellanilyticum TaxID=748857 RepID=A0A366HV69_9BACT|nr:hypothetical protein DES53_101231 [Roseimicrobium gellanilyticum]